MRAILAAALLALGWAGTAHADIYYYRYTLSENGNIITGALGGKLENDGNTFDIGSVISYAINGISITASPSVLSTDTYATGNAKAPTAKLDKSVIDFSITSGANNSFILGVGDQTAASFGSPFYEATVTYGGDGNLHVFNATAYSATVVPEPASVALLGIGLAGIVATRRRRAI